MASITANKEAAGFVMELIKTIFTDIAGLAPSVIDQNIALGCNGGWSEEDRSIGKNRADYLIANFGYIVLGFISNDVFRDSFKDAVGVELSLDDKDPDFVEDIRRDMADENAMEETQIYVIDLSVYNGAAAKELSKRIGDALDEIGEYKDEFNDLVDELTEDDTMAIGFVVCNFMYLIRAIDKNELFMSYIHDVVEAVKENLNK